MPDSKEKPKTTRVHVILAFIIVFGPIGYWLFSGSGKSAKPTTTFKASLSDVSALDPATSQFLVQVENTGTNTGTPICQVKMQNETGTYSGFDTFNALDHELKPGEKWGFKGTVTVTNQGAAYVTTGSVNCYN